jgi:hypothetical protein
MHNSLRDGVLFSYVFSILVMFNDVAFYFMFGSRASVEQILIIVCVEEDCSFTLGVAVDYSVYWCLAFPILFVCIP